MNKGLKLREIDFRYILIQSYKELGLTENELVVLLLVDSVSKDENTLITGDLLRVKMNIEESEIDALIISLMNKGFLSYAQEDILYTSIEPTYNKVLNFVNARLIKSHDDDENKLNEDAFARVMQVLQEELKRSLTPLEIEVVQGWFDDKFSEQVIMDGINVCIKKYKKLTLKNIEKTIVKIVSSNDINEEGYSTIDEKTKKDLKRAMEAAKYDWISNDD